MKVVTAQEMRDIDRAAIEEYGIPALALMERAGLAVALKVRELYPSKKITVLCGGGNNGGDGLVAARNLVNWGIKTKVLMFSKKNSLSRDCAIQYKIAANLGIPMEFRKIITDRDLHGAVVIDAIFGTGLSRPAGKEFARAFMHINKSESPVISVDIPSGISSDTGEILGAALTADCTVTFGLPKRGHFLCPGAEYSGRLFIEDIGFPAILLDREKLRIDLIDKETLTGLMPARQKNSYKGDYGHVLVIAGSRGRTGAALMTSKACLRSGSGIVTLGVPESLMSIFQSRVTEEMTLPLSDNGSGMISLKAMETIFEFACEKADVIAVGPGIGVSSDTRKIMDGLIRQSTAPLVIDADGINSISDPNIFRKAKSPVILTPHPGEMARLIKGSNKLQVTSYKSLPPHPPLAKGGMGGYLSLVTRHSSQFIERNRIDMARSFSKEYGVYLALKGVPTVIAAPEGNAFINTTGNPGMAAAGSGDVLTGIIASLLGQGLDPAAASSAGVYIHGVAGDIAAARMGEQSLMASDIINFLSEAFIQLLDNSVSGAHK